MIRLKPAEIEKCRRLRPADLSLYMTYSYIIQTVSSNFDSNLPEALKIEIKEECCRYLCLAQLAESYGT